MPSKMVNDLTHFMAHASKGGSVVKVTFYTHRFPPNPSQIWWLNLYETSNFHLKHFKKYHSIFGAP